MDGVIRKWVDSPALRLPMAVLDQAGLRLWQKVHIVVSPGRIVIQPTERVEYDLDELVGGITAQNAHGEFDFGTAVGKEAF